MALGLWGAVSSVWRFLTCDTRAVARRAGIIGPATASPNEELRLVTPATSGNDVVPCLEVSFFEGAVAGHIDKARCATVLQYLLAGEGICSSPSAQATGKLILEPGSWLELSAGMTSE